MNQLMDLASDLTGNKAEEAKEEGGLDVVKNAFMEAAVEKAVKDKIGGGGDDNDEGGMGDALKGALTGAVKGAMEGMGGGGGDSKGGLGGLGGLGNMFK